MNKIKVSFFFVIKEVELELFAKQNEKTPTTIISINYLGLQLSPFEINGSTEPLFDGASQKQMASEERTIIYAWFNVGFIADHCSKNHTLWKPEKYNSFIC